MTPPYIKLLGCERQGVGGGGVDGGAVKGRGKVVPLYQAGH